MHASERHRINLQTSERDATLCCRRQCSAKGRLHFVLRFNESLLTGHHEAHRGAGGPSSKRIVRARCFVETSPYSSVRLELPDSRSADLSVHQHQSVNYDFVVIGSGIAGLTYALKVAEHGSVAVVTKESLSEGCTVYAQGGVCAVLDPLDSVQDHVQDTMVAGNFLNDEGYATMCFCPCFCTLSESAESSTV